ncbi:ammonium transporter [Halotalea alkalilenta]|uniref:Ammonium transporter n=1 Tax=Halotalea alkalilenta TaxID=376489 RepID=A0A172YCA7_9GAMM|nr:ammonium transporter [Halotalea alkalilenta]ANF56857.1 ammonia channel protein [Halotalea alkalilenta]
MSARSALIPAAGLFGVLPLSAFAQEAPPVADSGDTAWMLVSTVLVLMMTIPGLALYYGGLARSKNVLSVLMNCFAITALVSIIWVIYGYSLTFDATGMVEGVTNFSSFVGGFDRVFLSGLDTSSLNLTFPESIWITFQMTFAIITPALIVGAFAERMKFSAMLWFTGLWVTFVYFPIAHMVWGGPGAFMGSEWGVIDFAGGTVVHINSGIAGLVACIVIGKRKGYPTTHMAPHNLGYSMIGASLLWLGWFGFNAGSAGAADGSAGMAMLVTQIATAAAALGWMFAEWSKSGKPSLLGIITGAIAGLVAVTPAAGTCGPMGAIILGAVAGVISFFASTSLKRALGYDDSFDVFGVHGVAGIVGSLLTGAFAAPALGGFGEVTDIGLQLWIQLKGVLFTIVYTGIISYILLKIIDATIGLRVTEEQEGNGLDLSLHNERGYNL